MTPFPSVDLRRGVVAIASDRNVQLHDAFSGGCIGSWRIRANASASSIALATPYLHFSDDRIVTHIGNCLVSLAVTSRNSKYE
jgi:hypothetical protein